MCSSDLGQSVTFSDTSIGSVTSWQWIIGSFTFTTKDVTLTPTVAGTVSVTLTVTGSAGSATVTRDVLVLAAAPTASFALDRATVYVGDLVQFTDSAPSAAIRTWDFGDGTGATAATSSVTHSFATPGPVTVTLTVSPNGYTVTSSQSFVVQLQAPAPVVSAFNQADGSTSTGSSFSVVVGDTVDFSDVGTSTLATGWSWNWGDGAPGGSSSSVTRTFVAEGTYVLTLQVTNGAGTGTATFTVIVAAAPAG